MGRSNDTTKIQTEELSILPSFYFHEVLEQLKNNILNKFSLAERAPQSSCVG